ncbi:MAG TPA: tRNA uridine-5-carboxymethylaminomethyl(34) synthesis enzyme MnmG [Lentisphaeria bacterium]|nr:tRNA uridine-5-carboxymethylaminomethyl(34) synthesis enzyme MnmG [Lentisphaeria bacterium]
MSDFPTSFDVIVIGGGHAGCEAALAAGRMGARTMLLTMNIDHIAQMSCNPAVGGIAKGQVVREIDALGGEMAMNTDACAIQFRMLNRSKGPAVWSPRAQTDKVLYQRRMKYVVESERDIFVHQAEAVELTRSRGKVTGVSTQFGDYFEAKAVVICTGTFLRGLLHYGDRSFPGGRAGDAAAESLALCLVNDMELEVARLKTGTPPRIMGHTIDFEQMQEQSSEETTNFSHWPDEVHKLRSIAPEDLPQKSCYLLKSTTETRQIVLDNIERSPMYNGRIKAVGTRYCPSFEDKVMRFPHHETHQLYLEPEGAFTDEYYLNGISTSLPVDVQWQMVRSLPGMERAELARYAYAVEYDVMLPHQLHSSLALQKWPNLFLAGQINGTTGYEEAAGQGIVAGINAARYAGGQQSPLVLARDQAYIGVMIDDLVTKEITEPYRLFTSRAEYRLLLRQDTACRRLSKIGHEFGLLPAHRYARVIEEEKQLTEAREWLERNRANGESLWLAVRKKTLALADVDELKHLSEDLQRQLGVDAHYEGYVEQERTQAKQLRKLDHWQIPEDFSYDMPGLRNEARMKLERVRPNTLAQAARIDGVTPAEISLLQVHLKRRAG